MSLYMIMFVSVYTIIFLSIFYRWEKTCNLVFLNLVYFSLPHVLQFHLFTFKPYCFILPYGWIKLSDR
jgi:hypothetical protein